MTDALNAIRRLTNIFEAEVFEEQRIIEDKLDVALEVKNASFSWDAPPPDETATKSGQGKKKGAAPPKSSEKEKEKEHVFKMENVSLSVPHGQLIAIVGAVGAGKTSLLQGVIGEMRKTAGTVKFSGSVSYCPQTAWIQVMSR
jgi:ABC-type polysaccharide/polyol phosphate transport system ATPase subunit